MLHRPDPARSIADAALDLGRLAAYLPATAVGDLGPLTATRLTGGRSNLTYLISGGGTEFVLRRPPMGDLTPRAYDVAREFRMMDAMGRQGVRVPPLLHLCEDQDVIGAAFLLMERVHGTVLRDGADAAGLTREHRRLLCHELADALAELHAVDAESVVPGASRRGAGFVERQVRLWTDQWRRWRTRDLPVVDELAARLAASVPPTTRVAVVHGDFRFDNVMFDADLRALNAIFDWELSSVGDPLTDLGLLLTFWATDGTLADLLPHKRLTAALEVSGGEVAGRYAAATGASLDHLGFHIALGHFKWAVIRAGVYRRQLDGAMPDEDSAAIGASVEAIADHGLVVAGQAIRRRVMAEPADTLYEVEGTTAIVTINRPERYNAFRGATVDELVHSFERAWADPAVRVVVLTGAGEKAFCTGGDVKQRAETGDYGPTELGMFQIERLHRLIRDIPKPVIAAVNGLAVGGGHVLHVLCDISLASSTARFGQAGPRVGSFDAGFGSNYLARIVGEKRAREIWYLCRLYDAETVERWGLVNAVVEPGELRAEALRWAEEIARMSPTAIRFLKHAFNADSDAQAGISKLGMAALEIFGTSEEAMEGANAFSEKRTPDFTRFA